MKKNVYIFSLFALLIVLGCSKDDSSIISQVDSNVERGAILRTISVDPLNFDLRDPERSWNLQVEMEDNRNGNLLDFVNVFVTFFDNTPENGSNDVDKSFVKQIPANAFFTGENNLPRADLELTLPEVASAAGLTPEQYQGGDVFRVELELNLTDGRIFTKDDVNGGVAGGSFFRSPFQYRLTIVGCPPRPGTYTINMTDAYGDGWQSTTADDGPGIQVFADGILIAEVGICTDYNDSQDAWCSGGGSSGSDTIDIPDGVENLEWIFPGDFWGEMGFEILGPEGQVLYTAAEGSQAEGEFFVVLCRFD